MIGAYDMLIPPFRTLVDRLLTETEGEGWEVRRAYLASVYAALYRGRANAPNLDAEAALSAIIAAMIEKVGDPEIETPLQAGIYAASASPEHRQASAEWFDLHPDEFAALTKELAGGGVRMN